MFRRLVSHFGDPEKALLAERRHLLAVNGMTPKVALAISRHSMPEKVTRDLGLVSEHGFGVATFSSTNYPALLRHIPDPPPFLYTLGELSAKANYVAVVGSRNATEYGLEITFDLCRELASLGITVVSGMARGIDTAAHQGALAGNGRTVAVLGCGLGTVYPRENRELFSRVSKSGAVVTELPVRAGPLGNHFPARNRIIAGMSAGTIVVEAAKKSGSLITARLAAEQGREVFAVPGSIASGRSAGTHGLIKQGAALVESALDVVNELSAFFHAPCTKTTSTKEPPVKDVPETLNLSDQEKTVLSGLDPYPVHIDVLVRRLNMGPGVLSGILLQLELKGVVHQAPGKMFKREGI